MHRGVIARARCRVIYARGDTRERERERPRPREIPSRGLRGRPINGELERCVCACIVSRARERALRRCVYKGALLRVLGGFVVECKGRGLWRFFKMSMEGFFYNCG